MLKKFFALAVLSSLFISSALADDLLAKISNGAISDNSKGVKVLSLDEQKEVKGGYRFVRDSDFDFYAGTLTSYGYVVEGDYSWQGHEYVASLLGHPSGFIVAKYRYVNNQKEHYLQYFSSRTARGVDIWAYSGSPALEILNEFQRRY